MGKAGKAKAKAKTPTEGTLKYQGTKDPTQAARIRQRHQNSLYVVLFVDVCGALALFASLHDGIPASSLTPSSLLHFRTDSLDLILLSLLRLAALSFISGLATSYAYAEGQEMELNPAGTKAKKADASSYSNSRQGMRDSWRSWLSISWLQTWSRNTSSSRASDSSLTAPLLHPAGSSAVAQPLGSSAVAANGPPVSSEAAAGGHGQEGGGAAAAAAGCDAAEKQSKDAIIPAVKAEPLDPGFSEWFTSVSRKDVTIFASFLLCTLFQVYTGAKCVSFLFTSEGIQGALMGGTVLWINAENIFMSNLAEASGIAGRADAAEEKRRRGEGEVNAAPDSCPHEEAAAGAAEDGLPSGSGSAEAGGGGGGKGGGAPPAAGPPGSAAARASLDPVHAVLALQEGTLRGDKGARREDLVSPRAYLLRAISLAKEELPLLLIGFACLAVTSAAGLIIPHYQGRILDAVIRMDRPSFSADVFLMAMFSLVTGITGGIRGLCFSIVGKRLLKTIQDRLFNAIIIQDVAYFDATTSGELTSRLTNDVAAMSEPINWQLSALVRNVASLVGGTALCFFTSWKLSILAFTTMAPIWHITAVYSRWSRELNRNRYAVLAEANSAASEALANVRTVRAFSTEHIELARYTSKTGAAMRKGVRDALAYSGAVAINNWLDLGASVLILWYGGTLVMDGRMSIGKLITFQLYWNLIQSGYQSIMSVLMSLTKASGAAQRVLSLVDALPDIDPDAGTSVSRLHGDIQLRDVHFFYQMRPNHPVLRGITLSVRPGQVCAFVGRSGGGKSTLVHLLMRFYDPARGAILLDGMDLRSLNLRSVHAQMGLVAQETQVWACSIEENIAYGLPHYTRAQVEAAASLANAHDFIAAFPEGYATRVGERGVRLSGGQRQRIAIARMLLRRPSLLLLDEATSALDAESEALVQAALDRLISGEMEDEQLLLGSPRAKGKAEGERERRTIVLVAHRLSTVRNADIIAVLDGGRIVEQGSHEELVNIPNGVYERLVRRQLSRAANTLNQTSATITEEESDEQEGAHDKIDLLIE